MSSNLCFQTLTKMEGNNYLDGKRKLAKDTYRCEWKPACRECAFFNHSILICRLNEMPVRADIGICDAFERNARMDGIPIPDGRIL